jgi:hypothetical protein
MATGLGHVYLIRVGFNVGCELAFICVLLLRTVDERQGVVGLKGSCWWVCHSEQ